MKPSFVIFDCDGVLVDSEPATLDLLREDFAPRGLDLTLETADRLFTGGTLAAAGDKAREMGIDLPEGWVDEMYERMYARLAEGTPLIPGVQAVMDRLDAAGIPFAVGSNGSERKMQITLSQHPALYERVKNRLYSAHTYGAAKPDPTIFLAAAKDAGVAPADCAVIDDSPSGCRAGVAAGMRTLGFAADGDDARLSSVGAEVFHDMAELPARLGL
ncbi:HAD family phosphatase [Pseudoruegeria sp. HB172150]|uniref:HAD family hydrolase n=1 Tax=Pseudoruegeria sp. HB172150 TaxID=2721164 RepID=UPI0015576F09|nr:HAD family phosphatase [Pseudoruegeria sp. HB172150]